MSVAIARVPPKVIEAGPREPGCEAANRVGWFVWVHERAVDGAERLCEGSGQRVGAGRIVVGNDGAWSNCWACARLVKVVSGPRI